MNQSEVKFECNSNPFISFGCLIKNHTCMLTRSRLGTTLIVIAYLLLILIPFLLTFGTSTNKSFLLFLAFLYILFFISPFITYLRSMKVFPIFKVKALKFVKGENGFWVEYKDGQQKFVDYNNISEIRYVFPPQNTLSYIFSCIYSRRLQTVEALYQLYACHFCIKLKENNSETELAIPLNITNVYKALDIIVNHIPEQKRGNVQTVNGKVVVVYYSEKKSILGIDLEKRGGKWILIVLTIVVLGIWSFILYLVLVQKP